MQIDAIKNACSDPRWRPGSAAWASICASSAIPNPGASLALHLAGGEGFADWSFVRARRLGIGRVIQWRDALCDQGLGRCWRTGA
ncbi:hypothetical protein ACWGK7_03370 [Sphingomonas aurantiaca]